MLAPFLHIYSCILETEKRENTFVETRSFEKEFIEQTVDKLDFK
jgi:hypothetical protein